MIEVAVGSKNPTKLQAVRLAFQECLDEEFIVQGYAVKSGVSDQPMNDNEMMVGAMNRANGVAGIASAARYAVGLEGGIRVMHEGWFNLGWVCVLSTVTGMRGYGATLAHRIPTDLRYLMERDGLELCDAVSQFYGTNTVADRDCSGVITDGLLPADRIYSLGVVAAFADLRSGTD